VFGHGSSSYLDRVRPPSAADPAPKALPLLRPVHDDDAQVDGRCGCVRCRRECGLEVGRAASSTCQPTPCNTRAGRALMPRRSVFYARAMPRTLRPPESNYRAMFHPRVSSWNLRTVHNGRHPGPRSSASNRAALPQTSNRGCGPAHFLTSRLTPGPPTETASSGGSPSAPTGPRADTPWPTARSYGLPPPFIPERSRRPVTWRGPARAEWGPARRCRQRAQEFCGPRGWGKRGLMLRLRRRNQESCPNAVLARAWRGDR